jgi:para-nitrobenzyl esterase
MSSNLKATVLAALVVLAAPLTVTVAQAQAVVSQPAYSTQKSTVGELFDNPQTRAIVEKQFPGISSSFRMRMARGMTFRELNTRAPKDITVEKLNAIDAELAKLPK